MYDRKTWAILAICGSLLAVNLYYSSQNQQAAAAKRAREEALQKQTAATAEAPAKTTTAELTVEPPPPPTEEELVILKNDKVEFTLSNIGGGIKFAEFQNEFDVGSKDSRDRANRFGAGPIGALAGAGEVLENAPYAYKAEESTEGKKAVYIAKLPSGLIVKKTFTLNEGSEPGAPYLLDFDLAEQAGTQAIALADTPDLWHQGNDQPAAVKDSQAQSCGKLCPAIELPAEPAELRGRLSRGRGRDCLERLRCKHRL